MSNYSSFERRIAKFLSNNENLKNKIKKIYQYVNYTLNKKKDNLITDYPCRKVLVSSSESFFGYYDKSPFNNDYELFNITDHDTSLPPSVVINHLNKSYKIIVKSVETSEIIFEDNVSAFNWQQGSKAQWINNYSFVYNDIVSNKIVAKVKNLQDKSLEILEHPIYDAYKDEFYISIDYRPMTLLRPDYGYFSKDIDFNLEYENQSIDFCDFNGNSMSIIKLNELNELFPLANDYSVNKQKFNHIMISPNGDKFVFLHRAHDKKRIDRFFYVSNFKSGKGEVKLISDSGMISHYCWKDDSTLIAYMRHEGKDGYYLISICDAIIIAEIDIPTLSDCGDGHPTYIGGGLFITDTYPDKSRMKKLLCVDLNNKSFKIIAEFFEPLKYSGQTRCDLHPKWDAKNKLVYVDSVHEGKRDLYKVGPLL